MAIKNVVLRGFGNGTVTTTIGLVVKRGYGLGGTLGPFKILASQAHTPGSVTAQNHNPGSTASQHA
jgi:hypothetical protein